MHINVFSNKKRDLNKFLDRIPFYVDVDQVIKHTQDIFNENGSLNREYIKGLIAKQDQYYRGTTDLTYFLVPEKHYKRDGNYGIHLADTYYNSRVCIVRIRDNWEDTAEHELFHALWDYVYIHTGINLSTVLDVTENGAIHGDDPRYEEYEYDWLYPKVTPYYNQALQADNQQELTGLLKTAIRLARRRITQLRNQLEYESYE